MRRMMRRAWGAVFGLTGLAVVASVATGPSCFGQINRQTAVPATPQRVQAASESKVPMLREPVRLADFVATGDGMAPRPELAASLARVGGFTQTTPNDGRPGTERTEVWLGRTASTLYFVFVCGDHQVAALRTHMARRENILTDDTVSVLLDPFGDRRRGVLFTVNPTGVQADAAWTENSNPDYSYDQVWDSDARVTRTGWMALIAIPYRSLRFRPGLGDWGVVFERNLPRNSEVDFWPRVAANVSGVLTQEGMLRGIEGVTGSRNFQVNPYALAQNVHALNSLDPLAPYFSNRRLEGTAGGEAKAIVKDSVVVDATINPDFSQVESDQPQFTVNQRFPVFFPELRPFFLENANYFGTLITLLNTRNIAHPEFGARVTGRIGQTNLGILAIDDRKPGELFSRGDARYGSRAFFGVGRVSQDFGKGSNVGVMYTDEEFAGSWNRVGGVDFTARLNDHWTAQGQMVASSTQGLDTAYAAGPGSKLEFTRSGHSFNFDETLRDFSPGFVTTVGFLTQMNVRSSSTNANYQWFRSRGVLQSYGIETQNKFAFDHAGNRVYHYTQADVFVALSRKVIFAPIFGENSDTLIPAAYPVLTRNKNLTENYAGVVVKGAPLPQVNYNIVYTYGGNPNYSPVAGAEPSLLHENFMQALVTVQPLRALTVDNTYLLDRNRTARDGVLVFENQTLRTKLNYQFTRAFSARVIVEYDSLLTNPAETALVRTKQVSTSALLTWLPHPGTAIYVGYNNDLQNLDRGLCTRGLGGECDPLQSAVPRANDYLNDGRQVFVKASYLLRF